MYDAKKRGASLSVASGEAQDGQIRLVRRWEKLPSVARPVLVEIEEGVGDPARKARAA